VTVLLFTSRISELLIAETAIAVLFILFNFIFHLSYRGIGVPFLYAIHITVPLTVFVAILFRSSSFRWKRAGLILIAVLMLVQNSIFISRTNTLLRDTTVKSPEKISL
jgi:hypothetical protein